MNLKSETDPKSSFRAKVKRETRFPYPWIRGVYYSAYSVDIRLPRFLCIALWRIFDSVRSVYYWAKSILWVSTMYRGMCKSVGQGFRAGTFSPYVEGKGDIFLGKNVRAYGKQTFIFASIRPERPSIIVGDNSGFGHNVLFDIAGRLQIGSSCLIAGGVSFVDCGGHSIVPELRLKGTPPTSRDVRDISIGDNVWIGPGAYILPGASIGNNCVIAPNTSVSRVIPDNSLVYPVAPKVMGIRDISNVI